jgi:glucokinase
MLLAGDIGGTSTRLALFDIVADKLTVVAQTKYHSRDHAGLEEIARAFLTAQHATLTAPISHSAFGIAGPVREGKVHTSNLPWVVDATELSANLKIADVHLLNDLEANAAGIAALGSSDFVTLNAGQRDRHGNAAIISAGTGLGEAGIYFNGQQLYPFACEGGHSDFSPRNALEAELLTFLCQKFVQTSAQHVSWERVLSGPGLHNIYEFLRDSGRGKETPELAAALASGDPSVVISKAGLEGTCKICVQALEMFVSFYGAEAGNLALKFLATRGMYIGGGIAPKIIRKLQEPSFMEAFVAKGRMKSLLQLIPVHVITNDQTALLGAARYAAVRANLLPVWSG